MQRLIKLAILTFGVLFLGCWSCLSQSCHADELAPRFLTQSQNTDRPQYNNRQQPDLFKPVHPNQPVQSDIRRTQSSSEFNLSTFAPKPSDFSKITPYSKPILPRDQSSAQSTTGIATTLVALTFIVLFILIAARLWKKHGPKIGEGLPAEILEPLGKRYIDQKQAIQLVRLGTRILVLGSNQDNITTLAEITDPLEVDYLSGACRRNNEEQNVVTNFNKLFQRAAKPDFENRTNNPDPARTPQTGSHNETSKIPSVSWPQSEDAAVLLAKENGFA